jgi:hypothetical protein
VGKFLAKKFEHDLELHLISARKPRPLGRGGSALLCRLKGLACLWILVYTGHGSKLDLRSLTEDKAFSETVFSEAQILQARGS